MTTVQQNEANALIAAMTPLIHTFLGEAAGSKGDFHRVEQAAASAIQKVRALVMTSGLRVSSQCAERSFFCPACHVALHIWERRGRRVETREGRANYIAVRYRCPKCAQFHAPLEAANGLANSQFTTMAQGLIGHTAAQFPYERSSAVLSERGISVSAKEVDRMARDVASWRRDEENAVVSATFGGGVSRLDVDAPPGAGVPKLFNWSQYRHGSTVLVSVDGGRIRSPDRGPDGLEWFEARVGIIAPVEENSRLNTVYLGGIVSPDALFERLSAAWRQGPHKDCRVVFVADGATWIWDRVKLYFPGAVEVLDIYHAGEHVASAAAALWGEGSQEHKEWRRGARDKLLAVGGVEAVLSDLIAGLRRGNVRDKDALHREIAYLWRHRRRMRYHSLKQSGLPVGSGAMESAIKQVTTARLRQPGMKWTREGADSMIALRTAYLSEQLTTTAMRRHHDRLAGLNQYTQPRLQRIPDRIH